MTGRNLVAGTAVLVACLALAPAAGAKTFKSGFMSYERSAGTVQPSSGTGTIAECPGNRRISGPGGLVRGPARTNSPYTHIAGLWPSDGQDGDSLPDDRASVETYNASAAPVKAEAWAACLGPGAGGGGLSYASTFSPLNPFQNTNVGTGQSQACGDGVVGGGELISGPTDEEWLRGSGPDVRSNGKVDPSSWGTSFNIHAGATPHNAIVHAICATQNVHDKLKLRYTYEPKVIFQDQVRVAKARCPRNGGKGWKVLGGGWSGFTAAAVASNPFDNRDRGKAPEDGWRVKALHFPGGNAEALVAFAICGKRR